MIFDTHAHYDDDSFDNDREEVILTAYNEGVVGIVNMGVDIENSRANIEFVKKYDFMYGAVGVHPNEVGDLTDKDIDILRELSKEDKIIAIGEIGLDYYYDEPPRDIQKVFFEKQIELAREVKLPICVHSRDAAKDTLDMMIATHAEEVGGVVHCYSYSKEMAREFLKLNYFFGIGGVVTFKNAKTLKEVVDYLPIENIVLETDCPYLAPDPYRGKRNVSGYLKYVAKAIGDIKDISEEEVIRITNENAKRLYNL